MNLNLKYKKQKVNGAAHLKDDVLLSIAIQEYLVKKNNLNNILKKKKTKIKKYISRQKIIKNKENENLNYLIYKPKIYKKAKKRKLQKKIKSNVQKNIKKMTLLEKLDLIPHQKKNLNQKDWKKIKNKANKKKRIKNVECIICLEKFKFEEQILLDCAHCFHKHCFENFEKISNVKNCPICRNEDYEKIEICEGAEYFVNQSALKIQTIFRGFFEYKKFFEFIKKNKIVLKSKNLKRKFLLYKLSKIQNSVNYFIEKKNQKDQKFIFNFDKNKYFNDRNKLISLYFKNFNQNENLKKKIKVDWNEKLNIIKNRKNNDCAICIKKLKKNQNIFLLSCTHAFHKNCFIFFENYHKNKNCPYCRSVYVKKNLKLSF